MRPAQQSFSRFWISWTLVAIVAAACMYLPPFGVLDWFGLGERLQPYFGVVYLIQLIIQFILFWLMAAIGQWLVIRQRLPHGQRWGVMTFVGGTIATVGYSIAGSLLEPVWAKFLGVRVHSLDLPLFFQRQHYVHEAVFLAVQGAVFGGLLALLQSLVASFRGLGRFYLIAFSALAGAVALNLVWCVASLTMTSGGWYWYSEFVLRSAGLEVLVPPLLWVLYSAFIGIGLHYALNRRRRSAEDAIISSFD